VTHAGGKRYVLAGLGSRETFDAERARVAAASVVGRARELVSFARRQGYQLDELIRIIEDVG
jgi:hypothetical protein